MTEISQSLNLTIPADDGEGPAELVCGWEVWDGYIFSLEITTKHHWAYFTYEVSATASYPLRVRAEHRIDPPQKYTPTYQSMCTTIRYTDIPQPIESEIGHTLGEVTLQKHSEQLIKVVIIFWDHQDNLVARVEFYTTQDSAKELSHSVSSSGSLLRVIDWAQII